MEGKSNKKPNVLTFAIGPGPKYALKSLTGYNDHDPSKKRQPAFTIQFKSKIKPKPTGPGPYPIKQHLTNYGLEKAPEFTIAGRKPPIESNFGPGPGAYHTGNYLYNHQRSPPKYTHSFRRKEVKENLGPGPIYKLPTCIGADYIPDIRSEPAYSMAFRHSLKTKFNTPGPSSYNDEVRFKNAPKYSVKFRHPQTQDLIGPGPKYQCPTDVYKRTAPKFSFGVKYSPLAGIPFTGADED